MTKIDETAIKWVNMLFWHKFMRISSLSSGIFTPRQDAVLSEILET
jgi:hypothetical protein